jgi:5-methylcytosine-specific restriction protein A
MPTAVPQYCKAPGCDELVREGFCPAHERRAQRQYDDRRGSSHARGYGARWRDFVLHFRSLYPLCGMRPPGAPDTLDSECRAQKRVRPMWVVDHIVPVQGKDDPRFYDPTNHQALCEACHNRKRQRESRA